MTKDHGELQGVRGAYKWLHLVREGYKVFQGIIRGYKGLPGEEGVTGGYNW